MIDAERAASRRKSDFARTLRAVERINQGRNVAVPDLFSQVKEVVVVASSSRGGSSIFTEILRQSPKLIHFKGEINPFMVMAGLTSPASGKADDGLDALDAGADNQQKLAVLEREMAFDVGINLPVDLSDSQLRERFKSDLLWRVTIQWPEIEIDPDFVFACTEQTFSELAHDHGWRPQEFNDPQLFHVLLLARLRKRYPKINPHYYDLSAELIKHYCPDAEICLGPPGQCLIEEPPFVLISPRHPVSAEMLASHPLILKTPSNVYRLDFLQKIFHRASFRVLHLVRNPADAINGLVDGWLYHGFFSHPLPTVLDIKGYSDHFPEWGRCWWNYDLPPGWQQWSNLPLEYVCGYQWRQAHQTILDYLERNPVDSLRIAFEDVVGDLATRRRCFSRIAEWLGVSEDSLIDAAVGDLPPVMATARPRQRRWFKKVALLRPVLEEPLIIEMARRLGYEKIYDL